MLDLIAATRIEIDVVDVDVGDDADRRRSEQERAVALVGLEDERLAPPRARAAAGLVEVASDQIRRIETGPDEHRREHRRGGRLPVRAGNGDGPPAGGKGRDRLLPPPHRDPVVLGGAQLRVIRRDRARRDHDVGARRAPDRGGRVPDLHDDPCVLEVVDRARSFEIRTTYRDATSQKEPCEVPHARTADPDQMRASDARDVGHRKRRDRSGWRRPQRVAGTHPAAPATSAQRSAIRAAASGRAHASAAAPIAVLAASFSTSSRMARTSADDDNSRSSTMRAAPAATSSRAFASWWFSVACGYGTRIEGNPHAVTSAILPPARATTRSASANARSIRSTNGATATRNGADRSTARVTSPSCPGPALTNSWRSARVASDGRASART